MSLVTPPNSNGWTIPLSGIHGLGTKDSNFSYIPSKLLTSTMTHNFDRGSQKLLKNCRNFRAQERHPLSKAFKFEKCLEMPKKILDSC
jgi:hypothetical protein